MSIFYIYCLVIQWLNPASHRTRNLPVPLSWTNRKSGWLFIISCFIPFPPASTLAPPRLAFLGVREWLGGQAAPVDSRRLWHVHVVGFGHPCTPRTFLSLHKENMRTLIFHGTWFLENCLCKKLAIISLNSILAFPFCWVSDEHPEPWTALVIRVWIPFPWWRLYCQGHSGQRNEWTFFFQW